MYEEVSVLKGTIPSLTYELIPGSEVGNPETSILLLKPWNSTYVTDGTGHHIYQVEQHVLVFTIKRRCVPFIYMAKFNL